MILILTYAKVCTTSLYQLMSREFPGDVFRTHGLQPWITEPLVRFATTETGNATGLSQSFDNDLIVARLARARADGEAVTLMSGVRDPITRSLSVAMQNLESAFPDCRTSSDEATAEALASRLASLWMKDVGAQPHLDFLDLMIHAPMLWFERELAAPFGFDATALPFDRQAGYAVWQHENLRLLFFRHESAPEAIERGLAELFPGRNFSLPYENVGEDKPSAGIYRALQSCFRLPRPVLEAIYAHPSVRCFYGQEEVAAAIDRWSEPLPKRAWAAPPLLAPVAFAATVFVPLRNHAEYVGQLIDSLLTQWRPDIELVLVDDGSGDGSMDVALKHLARRPDVAATVMRNEHAVGHGMLPTVLDLSHAPVLIQADSDDIALPGRLDAIIDHFAAHPECMLLTSNAVLLSETGIPIRLLDTLSPGVVLDDAEAMPQKQNNNYWLGATSAYRRSIFEEFPAIDPELCPYGLDLLTGFRATLLGTHHYLARPLVGWRQHSKNSHRAIGAGRSDPAAVEHMASVHLMVRAQRLRDLAWLLSRGKIQAGRAVRIGASWRADFIGQVDEWIRLRNRLNGTHAAPAPHSVTASGSTQAHIPSVPPIITLNTGIECSAGQMDHALTRWAGLIRDDGLAVWTGRQALVVMRVPDMEARSLILTVAGLPYIERQTIIASLDFAQPVEATLIAGSFRKIAVPLAHRRDTDRRLVTLLISVPEAAQPVSFDPSNNDQRVLGARIFSMLVSR